MRVEREWEYPTHKSPGRWIFLVRINGQWGYGATVIKARLDALHGLGRTPCKVGRPVSWRGPFYTPRWTEAWKGSPS